MFSFKGLPMARVIRAVLNGTLFEVPIRGDYGSAIPDHAYDFGCRIHTQDFVHTEDVARGLLPP
jgi:hypothetical protein